MGQCLEALDSILLHEVQENATSKGLVEEIHLRFKEDYVEGKENCCCRCMVRGVNLYFAHTL